MTDHSVFYIVFFQLKWPKYISVIFSLRGFSIVTEKWDFTFLKLVDLVVLNGLEYFSGFSVVENKDTTRWYNS